LAHHGEADESEVTFFAHSFGARSIPARPACAKGILFG
jgi:hypothetical protein